MILFYNCSTENITGCQVGDLPDICLYNSRRMDSQKEKFSITLSYSNSINSLGNSLLSIKHSTRNNSLSEEMLMVEDMTLFNHGEAGTEKNTLEENADNEERTFSCEECKEVFINEKYLQMHIQSHVLKFKCDQCSYAVECKDELSIHIAKEHQEKINCDDCSFTASSTNEIENHINQKHKVKELYSCKQCDFDSEVKSELGAHTAKNIHDIRIHNISIKEQKKSKCHLCEYETNENRIMDEHLIYHHGFICCEKCEYMSEDNVLMKQHKMKHTGTSIFYCGRCEFEATRQIILENHLETKHAQKSDYWWQESQKCVYYCDKCEKKFQNLFVMRYHICVQETKYACPKCEFMAITLHEHLTHLENKHTKEKIKCESCDFEGRSPEEINGHAQIEHKTAKVDIDGKDQIDIMCDQCEYKCRLNIQLKKHKKTSHLPDSDVKLKYKCDACSFASEYIMHLWDHRQKLHPEQLQDFSPRPKDMVLSLLAEQNIDIIDAVDALKKDIKNNLMEFASMMQGCFEAVGQDIKYASNINHQAILDLSAKIDEKAKVFEKSQQTDVPHSNTRACSDNVEDETEGPSKKPTKDLRNCKDDGRDGFKENQKKIKVRQNKRHKVTWVGTSISKALDREKFEKDLNVDLTVVKAYCIEEEGRFQKTNFRAIVPDVVAKGGIDTLVLQTGSIEITNIDTNKAAMDPKKDIKDYEREWYAKVEDDPTNLFSIAEEAIARDDKLNVIIVKRLPRYDQSSRDIMAIKSKLSSFSNHVYDQLWLKRGYI